MESIEKKVNEMPITLVKKLLVEMESNTDNMNDEDLRDSLLDSAYGHGEWLVDRINGVIPDFSSLGDEHQKLVIHYGYNGMFATRKTVDEAGEYLQKIVNTIDKKDVFGLITGIQVLINTMAIERAKEIL